MLSNNNLHKSKLINTILVIVIILSLTLTNFIVVGNALISYAMDSNLNSQNDSTTNKNVKFNTFFDEGNGNTHYLVYDVNGTEKQMYINLSVDEGYLKDATIEFKDMNYAISNITDESGLVQENKNNTLVLRQINANTNASLTLSINGNLSDRMELNNLDKNSTVLLKGTYVDNEGEEKNIEKEIVVNVKLTGEYEAQLSQQPNSYVIFNDGNSEKALVSVKVMSDLKETENKLPIKDSKLEIEVPKLNGIQPEDVRVLANSTESTNGKTIEEIKQEDNNTNYDKENAILTIETENKEEDGKVWNGKGTDEYIITYIYPIEAIDESGENTLTSTIKAEMEMYNGDKIQGQTQGNILLREQFGQMVSLTLGTLESNINKGKMYANSQREEKEYETIYNMEIKANIEEKNFIDGIRISDLGESFEDINGNKYATTIGDQTYTYYKKIKVSKTNFEEVLGIDGKITIYDENGNILGEINKDTKLENERYVFEGLAENVGHITLETTKPVKEGTISIEYEKAIRKDLPYSKEQLRNFVKFSVSANIVEKQGENYVQVENESSSIKLEETNTKANIQINKDTLSTIVNNENVEIKIELDNNRENTDLYINPVFRIELPEYIEDINVKEANVLFDDNLKIVGIQKYNDNGRILLEIALEGVQDGFSNGTFTNGTNIVLNTDIKAKLLTPNKTEEVKLYYYNSNAISYEETTQMWNQELGTSQTEIEFSAPVGMLAVNSITNYEDTGKSIISVEQGKVEDKIEIYDEAKIAKMNMMIINNTENTANNIIAIGRIPFKGNKTIESNTDLGTTIDTILRSQITTVGNSIEGMKIYYSENGDATEDLSNVQNGWQENPTDFTKIKSYMIVLENYEMKAGEMIELSYDFEIPANLEHENSLYGTFEVKCTENSSVGANNVVSEADIVGLTTGEGPKINVEQKISVGEGQPIQEGQIIKYTINITNTGKNQVEDVYVKDYIPDFTRYAVYQEGSGSYGEVQSGYTYPETKVENGKNYIDWNIEKIEVGQTVTQEFELLVEKLPTLQRYYEDNLQNFGKAPGYSLIQENGEYYLCEVDAYANIVNSEKVTEVPGTTAVNTIELTAKDLAKELTNSNEGNKIEKSYFDINERTNIDKNTLVKEGEELIYTIDIKNTSEDVENNVVAQKVLPDGTEYKEAYIQEYNEQSQAWENRISAEYNASTGRIVWNLGTINSQESKRIRLVVTAAKLPDGTSYKDIITTTTVYADGISNHVSEETINTVAKPVIETNISSNITKEYMAEGDRITYTITVKNTGRLDAGNLKIEDILPDDLRFISGSYEINNGQNGNLNEYNNKVELYANILAGGEINLTIVAEAKNLPNDVDERQIVNYATVSGDNFETVKTAELTNIIEQSATLPNPPDESGTGDNQNGNLGGDNQDGTSVTDKKYRIRGTVWVDANENGTRENTEEVLGGVTVMLVDANTGNILQDENGNIRRIITANDGTYVFDNLDTGNYMVVFQYDTNIYGLTDYNKTGVNEGQNSDVIESTMTENGETKTIAVTNAIRITDSSYANIDMGLVYKNKFDLKIDKYVTKITVQNKDGVKTYNYNNSKLAKVDITAKKIAGSTVIIEYGIKVTNEGNTEGYAKNIVDYKPTDLEFKADLNPTWYAGNDGNVYSNELANTVIKPGETKEIKLVLTKEMTETNAGVSNNRTEIYEDYNDYGMKDLDSIVKNNAQGEDDLSSADVIITVSTGGAVAYTCGTIIVLLLMLATLYIIRKKTARYYN